MLCHASLRRAGFVPGRAVCRFARWTPGGGRRSAGGLGRRSLLYALAVLVLAVSPGSSRAEDTDRDQVAEGALKPALEARYERWLEDVSALMTEAEREAFLSIREDYQRDHFMRRFWSVRDPFPQTPVNEFEVTWEARAAAARELFGDLEGEGARIMLYLGEPSRRERLACSEVMEAIDVWHYADGTDRIAGYFTVVFTGARLKDRFVNYRVWSPSQGLRTLMNAPFSTRGDPQAPFGGEPALARTILKECTRGDDILAALSTALDPGRLDRLLPSAPSDEWVQAFQARSTDMPEGAEPMAGELAIDYPGRHQSRTVIQGLVTLRRDGNLVPDETGRFYNLLVDGEVLRKGKLFDTFRYRFDFPAAEAGEVLPLVVERYLRPGPYELIVKVEDIHSKRVFREEREIEVPIYDPSLTRAALTPAALTPAAPAGDAPVEAGVETADAPPVTITIPRLLTDANDTISTGDNTIEILDVPDLLTVGKLRVTARTRGEGIARVAFELNGELKMKKTQPPYSVELDLGSKPRIHTVRAIALDAEDRQLAVDEILVNAGPQRFSIRLIEPQPGKRYTGSVRIRAEVEVPEQERLDRVEVFLNDRRLATLYQPPYELPLLLGEARDFTYVRAVAYLADGNSAEDLVIINAPEVDFQDISRVDFKELYTTVVTKKGEFVEDLRQEEVKVIEDGVEQGIRRFEKVRDMPIIAGLMIDTSTSMAPALADVRRAAHRFLETVLRPKDRAALMTFNDAPQLVVRFTSDTEVLAGGLTGLVAEGETALYDSVIFALHYLSGGSGKRAIVLLTDGEDSSSTYSFDDAIDFARHTGVAIYVIGLGLPSDPQARSHVRLLATETGGESHFIDRVEQLGRVYEEIQQELRSQYLIGYQSSNSDKPVDQFRKVEVLVDRKGVEARTIRGYFP